MSIELTILREYQSFGAGDRMRILDRCGISRKAVRLIPPHEQLKRVTKIISSSKVIQQRFWNAVNEIRDEG